MTLIDQHEVLDTSLDATASGQGLSCDVDSPIFDHVDDDVDIAVDAPTRVFVCHENAEAIVSDVTGGLILDHVELGVMGDIDFDELVVDLRLDLNFKFVNKAVIRHLVPKDVGDVSAPTENHALALFQIEDLRVERPQVVGAFVHARDCDEQSVANSKLIGVDDGSVSSLTCAVPGGSSLRVDMLALKQKNRRVNGEICLKSSRPSFLLTLEI